MKWVVEKGLIELVGWKFQFVTNANVHQHRCWWFLLNAFWSHHKRLDGRTMKRQTGNKRAKKEGRKRVDKTEETSVQEVSKDPHHKTGDKKIIMRRKIKKTWNRQSWRKLSEGFQRFAAWTWKYKMRKTYGKDINQKGKKHTGNTSIG